MMRDPGWVSAARSLIIPGALTIARPLLRKDDRNRLESRRSILRQVKEVDGRGFLVDLEEGTSASKALVQISTCFPNRHRGYVERRRVRAVFSRFLATDGCCNARKRP